ncbi:hypothetical protein Vlu01_39630 [Micromonospora lutea]|uniref:Uncharacterized protein n=1 Tax=Micromonospora lutea TaxID=419825 RepID=A0ABQ4IZL0_9ACTN|nr:hypothetical protein Vlu01_39630 [Micromonospora lutea]
MAQGHGAAQARHSQSGRSATWNCDVICVLLSAGRLAAGPSVADVPDGPASVAPVLSDRIRAVPMGTVWCAADYSRKASDRPVCLVCPPVRAVRNADPTGEEWCGWTSGREC